MTTLILGLALLGNLQLTGQEAIRADGWLSSAGGRYQYQTEFTKDGIGETPVKLFSLSDDARRPLLTLSQPEAENFMVSDAGWFVGLMGIPGRRHVTFYDAQGSVVARQELKHDANYAFAPLGRHFYVNTGDGLRAYDARGRQTNRYAPGDWFTVSPDEQLVALVRNRTVTVYRAGRPNPTKLTLGSLLFRHLAFSSDGQLMAVIERATVSLYSLRTGERLWSDPQPEGTSLLRVAVASDGTVYVGGEEYSIADAGFLAKFIHGTELSRVTIPYQTRNEGLTGVRLVNGEVRVRTSDHELRFREAE